MMDNSLASGRAILVTIDEFQSSFDRSTRVTKTPPGDDPFDASSSSDDKLLLPSGGGGGGEERRSSWSPGDRSSSPRLPYQKSDSFRRQTTIETQHVMLQENDVRDEFVSKKCGIADRFLWQEGTKLNQYIIRDEIGMVDTGTIGRFDSEMRNLI